jgi:hypothetical protein
MRRPRVEIIYVDGCPNHEPTRALVERLAGELGVEPEIELVEVVDADAAIALRFLGSATVRVSGADVEPGAEERREYGFSCRIYRSEDGAGSRTRAGSGTR